MKKTLFLSPVLVAALVVLGQGCLFAPAPAPSPSPDAAMKNDAMQKEDAMIKDEGMMKEDAPANGDAMMPKTDEGMMKDEGMQQEESMMKQERSTYEPFTQAKYDAARAAGKPIFLFFYANWCPTCAEQDPRNRQVVPSHPGGIVGLRVNYNDTDTDDAERALAREFGVTYQHTGFFIGADGQIKKKTIGFISNDDLNAHLDLITP